MNTNTKIVEKKIKKMTTRPRKNLNLQKKKSKIIIRKKYCDLNGIMFRILKNGFDTKKLFYTEKLFDFQI